MSHGVNEVRECAVRLNTSTDSLTCPLPPMRIVSLKGTGLELTDAIKTYVNERVESLLKLCESFDPADELRIEVGKMTQHHQKGPYFRAEMQLHVPGQDLRAVEEAEDLHEAIDLAKDHLKRQLKEYKDRLVDQSQKGPRPGKE